MPDYDDDIDRRDDFDDRDRDRPRGDDVIRRAKDVVRGPAIAMIVISVLTILSGAYWAFAALSPDFDKGWDTSIDAQVKQQPTEEKKKEFKETMDSIQQPTKSGLLVLGLVSIGVGLLSILACVRIMGLKGRGLGYFISLLNMLPVTNCLCCLGLPFGIWMMITLGNSNVKAGFAAMSRQN